MSDTGRIEHLYKDVHEGKNLLYAALLPRFNISPSTAQNLFLHYGDLADTTNLVGIIAQVQPTEVYNLAAQSHVKVSFDMAEYTVSVAKGASLPPI